MTATGVLSVPYFPDVPGREEFRGESFHTGLWPTEPVDFAGKRVAVIGTGSSGVQVIPAIAGEVASLTVYQRTANWCTPLNNAPITAEEQAQLRADFEAIRETLNTSPSGFLHPVHDRKTFDDPTDARLAFFEKMWQSPGFSKLTSNYVDLTVDHAANALWCEFIAAKVRDIVKDPGTAERLIPKDHRFAEKRPPFVTGYYETFNNSERLPGRSEGDADHPHHRRRGSRRRTGCRSSTSSCGRPGSTSGPGRWREWVSAAGKTSRWRTTGGMVRRRSSAL